MTTSNKAAVIGASLGFLVPVTVLAALFIFDAYGIEVCGPDKCNWILWIWPTMVGMFLLDLAKYHGSAMVVILIYALMIWLNMLIYAGVAWVGAAACSRTFRRN